MGILCIRFSSMIQTKLGVMVNLEPGILGTQSTRQEYTLNRTPVHYRASCMHTLTCSFTPWGKLEYPFYLPLRFYEVRCNHGDQATGCFTTQGIAHCECTFRSVGSDNSVTYRDTYFRSTPINHLRAHDLVALPKLLL